MKSRIAIMTLSAALLSAPVLFSSGCAVTSGRESAGAYASDKATTARIKAALLGDPEVKGTQVNVTTFKGEVQLSGFVESETAKRRAEEIARSTPGVTQVHNDLILPTGR